MQNTRQKIRQNRHDPAEQLSSRPRTAKSGPHREIFPAVTLQNARRNSGKPPQRRQTAPLIQKAHTPENPARPPRSGGKAANSFHAERQTHRSAAAELPKQAFYRIPPGKTGKAPAGRLKAANGSPGAESPAAGSDKRKNSLQNALQRVDLWSGLRGSNSLPPPWQGGALPDELNPLIGAFDRNRTSDTRIFSPLLYRLSYKGKIWRPGWGSNPRPLA